MPETPFTRRARRSAVGAVLAFALFAVVPAAHAQVWNEIGDAGDLVSTAQVTVGTGSLTTINGTLGSPSDVDLFCIEVFAPRVILTIAALQCVTHQGPNIWVFDANGLGVTTNATCSGGSKAVGTNFMGSAGTYYVAVSYSGVDPFSGAGAIWLPSIGGERAPDGPGAAGVLAGWAGTPVVGPGNPYQIALGYTSACDAPTPAAGATWGALKIRY